MRTEETAKQILRPWGPQIHNSKTFCKVRFMSSSEEKRLKIQMSAEHTFSPRIASQSFVLLPGEVPRALQLNFLEG